jgi:hypothetical protein
MWCGVVVGAAIEARRLLSVEREHDAMSVHNFTIALKPILAFTITHHGLGREQRTHPASFLQVLSINHLCNPNTGPHVDGEIPPPLRLEARGTSSTRHVLSALRPVPPPTLVEKLLRVCWLENWRRLHPYMYTVPHARHRLEINALSNE